MRDTTASGQASRRTLLAGAGAAGVLAATAATTLAGCGSDSGSTGSGGQPAATGAAAGADLGKASDVPVGGGKIFEAQKVVVTQPAAGEFKAFTAVCTHQGCTVSSVSNGIIMCPCHGSQFSITDGSVKGGPAPAPLASQAVTVKDGELTLG
jgi:Rieske Fe-S protein